MGKTALMRYAADQASGFRVVQIAGVESEMELPFAGLHQLCAPLLDRLDALPAPQQDALRVALGLAAGDAPDRFLVGLAALTPAGGGRRGAAAAVPRGRSAVARRRLRAGARVRRAAAAGRADRDRVRRPRAERRAPARRAAGAARCEGLGHEDARALLATVVARPARRARPRPDHRRDARQPARPAGAAAGHERGGAGGRLRPPGRCRRSGTAEGWFLRRLEPLPADTRRLLQLAAADPVGEPLLVWRAAERLGIDPQAAAPAVDAGLLEIGAQVRFRHPCVRSAVYRSALAGGAARAARRAGRRPPTRSSIPTGAPGTAPRRRPGPTSRSPSELERSAGRALARGGIAAAAAFLEQRGDAHARARLDARGACSPRRGRSATPARWTPRWSCWSPSRRGRLDALQAAEIEQLRGEIAFDQRRIGEAARLLVGAARRFEPLDAEHGARDPSRRRSARRCGPGPDRLSEAAEAARAAPPAPDPPSAADLLLDAFAIRVTDGYAAAAPALRRALDAVLALEVEQRRSAAGSGSPGPGPAPSPPSSCGTPTPGTSSPTRQVQVARDMGALVRLQFALHFLVSSHLLAGDLAAAAQAIEEERAHRRGDRDLAGRLHRDDARGLARPGGADVGADRARDGRGARARDRAGWATSRPTRRRCSTTGSAATTPP